MFIKSVLSDAYVGINKTWLMFVFHNTFVISVMLTMNSEYPAECYLTGLNYWEIQYLLSLKRMFKYYAAKIYSYISIYLQDFL